MSTTDLSRHDDVPDATGMKIGIVVSEWNSEVTFAMKDGAFQTLLDYGVRVDDITMCNVPGSFELTAGAQMLAEQANVDAIICIGSVIRGETPHFDYICDGATYGLTELSIRYKLPVIFGVLTTDNLQQALDRAGGKHGNKGVEAAVTAIKMVALKQSFAEQ